MAETETETSILDDVRAAVTEIETGAPPVAAPETPPEAPPAETAQQTADRVRDEQGRFAKADEKAPRETLKLKEKPQEQPALSPAGTTVPSPTKDVPAAPAVQNGLDAPPLHWKGSQKVAWGKLPAEVRQGVLDDHKALQEERARFEPMNRVLEPHRERLIREGGSLEGAVGQLAEFHAASLTNPVGLALHILQARGIDPRQFAAQILGQQPQGGTQGQAPQTPDINSLIRQTVQQEFQPIRAQFEQAEQQQTLSVIEAFRADPKHPFFEDVKVHMGHLLRLGADTNGQAGAKNMQDAYDQATWANPVIRQHLTAAQAEEARQASNAAAQKARQASAASLRGSPLPNGSGATSATSSVHDDVRAAAAEIAGA